MTQPLKILVCGDVEGKLNQLFKRIEGIQKKAGTFDMLFCVGDFFGRDSTEWKEYENGSKKIPIATFILGPNKQEHAEHFQNPDGHELCPNLTFLGRKGLYNGSSGLKVAYLSGVESEDNGKGDDTHFAHKDVEDLQLPRRNDSSFRGVDLLLTSPWPQGVEKYGPEVGGGYSSQEFGSAAISQLALTLKPRYHFSALDGMHYERQPYRNHKVLLEGAQHVTRFIALAKVGNPQKKKYLYAFNIVPMSKISIEELIKQTDDVTECPYKLDSSAIKSSSQEDTSAQFFYDQEIIDSKGPVTGKKRKSHGAGGPDRKKFQPKPQGPCWFCLASPEVEKHLVVSVGDDVYLALAKGGLVPDHVLILPVGHIQSTTSAPAEVIAEIEKYKSALRKCYKKQGKCVVFFERNFKTSHLQIQAVPIPSDVENDLTETFQDLATQQKFELQQIPKMTDLRQIIPAGAPYFYAEMPDGDKLLTRISKFFPLQFGREALAHDNILGIPHKADWRNCKFSKEEESEMAATFRKIFEKYDFTE